MKLELSKALGVEPLTDEEKIEIAEKKWKQEGHPISWDNTVPSSSMVPVNVNATITFQDIMTFYGLYKGAQKP